MGVEKPQPQEPVHGLSEDSAAEILALEPGTQLGVARDKFLEDSSDNEQ